MRHAAIGLLFILVLLLLVGCPDPVDEPSTYSVTYDGNGNDSGNGPVDSASYESGESVTVMDHGTLARNGYTFHSWNTGADGSGLAYQPGDTFFMGPVDVTLYAFWIVTPTYSVEYVSTGHTAGDAPEDTSLYEEGDEVTVMDQGTLLRTDFTFEGWNTQDDFGGTTYAPGATFDMGSLNVSLFAVWEPVPPYSHTITIDGTNDFVAVDEEFATTTAGATAYFAWDDTYFYFGMNGADIDSGSADKHLLLYVDAISSGYPVGRAYSTETPSLPFDADYHFHWQADGTSMPVYATDDTAWFSTGISLGAGDLARSGTFIEGRVALADMVAIDAINVHMSMVSTTALAEWTYAGVPSTSFTDGLDPDYSTYYRFHLNDLTTPNAHLPQ